MLSMLLSNTEVIWILLMCQSHYCTYKVLNQDWLCIAELKNLVKKNPEGKDYREFCSS